MGVAALACYLGDTDRALERVGPPLEELEVSLSPLTQFRPQTRRRCTHNTGCD
jgi:hypothetical protein